MDIVITAYSGETYTTNYDDGDTLRPKDVDKILVQYKDDIKNVGYYSERVKYATNPRSHNSYISDVSRLSYIKTKVYCINPNSIFDDDIMLSYSYPETSLGPTE